MLGTRQVDGADLTFVVFGVVQIACDVLDDVGDTDAADPGSRRASPDVDGGTFEAATGGVPGAWAAAGPDSDGARAGAESACCSVLADQRSPAFPSVPHLLPRRLRPLSSRLTSSSMRVAHRRDVFADRADSDNALSTFSFKSVSEVRQCGDPGTPLHRLVPNQHDPHALPPTSR